MGILSKPRFKILQQSDFVRYQNLVYDQFQFLQLFYIKVTLCTVSVLGDIFKYTVHNFMSV